MPSCCPNSRHSKETETLVHWVCMYLCLLGQEFFLVSAIWESIEDLKEMGEFYPKHFGVTLIWFALKILHAEMIVWRFRCALVLRCLLLHSCNCHFLLRCDAFLHLNCRNDLRLLLWAAMWFFLSKSCWTSGHNWTKNGLLSNEMICLCVCLSCFLSSFRTDFNRGFIFIGYSFTDAETFQSGL